jgi:hypothetical protein
MSQIWHQAERDSFRLGKTGCAVGWSEIWTHSPFQLFRHASLSSVESKPRGGSGWPQLNRRRRLHVRDKGVRWTRQPYWSYYMQRLFFHLQCLVIRFTLLACSVASHADSCVMFHKRAPVRAVCGRIINLAGEKLNNVDLTLTGETGSVLFTTRSDQRFFLGWLNSKG